MQWRLAFSFVVRSRRVRANGVWERSQKESRFVFARSRFASRWRQQRLCLANQRFISTILLADRQSALHLV